MNADDWASMPRRTRVFARALKLAEKGIETVTDIPAHRAKRAKLQASPVGRWLFGAPTSAVDIDEVEITGLDVGGRQAVVYRPRGAGRSRPVVINYHGGGWVQGNPEQSGWLASRVAARTGSVVISPVYRLAPEHPYPAAADDAWTVLRWVADHADELGVDAGRIVVMGDSAGGNLAAVTALRSRDEDGPTLRGQVLIYPAVEMYDKYPSEIRLADAPLLSSASMRAFVRLYLGDQYGVEDAYASPIRAASLAGLPEAFIATAALDPLLDNGTRYRDALLSNGTVVEHRNYDGAIHGFMSLPGVSPPAEQALRDMCDFVARVTHD